MKGDHLPGEDNIAHLCFPKNIVNEQIQATAFQLRKGIDKYLSVNWLEYLGCWNRNYEIEALRDIYSKKLSVGKKSRIAVLNVGGVIDIVQKESPDKRKLDILHIWASNDPSYSGIYNLREDDQLISELILEVVNESHPFTINQ